jgi:hypothetical protein
MDVNAGYNLSYVNVEVRIAVKATCLFRISASPSTKLPLISSNHLLGVRHLGDECFKLGR